MLYRKATTADIEGMSRVRMAVVENRLSNPALVTPESYRKMLEEKGAGWVCEVDGTIVGFAIVDLSDFNIWALFVEPGQEGKGIGRELHDRMLAWSFEQGVQRLWLSTDQGTRAEKFYRIAGWQQTGVEANGEIRFEIDNTTFQNHRLPATGPGQKPAL